MYSYEIHGLGVRAEIPLAAWPADGRVDVRIELGRVKRSASSPGPIAAQVEGWHDIIRSRDGFSMRVPDGSEYEVSSTLVSIFPAQSVASEMLSILASGAALTLVLLCRGVVALHASAVDFEDSCVAIVGSSGQGKSTVAALLCAAGAGLRTDDVLRVDASAALRCYAGAPEIRLRGAARSIGDLLPAWSGRQSVDGRWVIQDPRAIAPAAKPLRALFVLGGDAPVPRVEPIAGAEKLVALLRHPRMLGWRDATVERMLASHCAELARRVPVFALSLPRGAPNLLELAHALKEVVASA